MKTMQKGFTLIELMIVVAIIGILAAIALPAYQDYTNRAKMSEVLTFASSGRTAVAEFFQSEGRLPTSNEEAGLAVAGEDDTELSTYVTSVTITTEGLVETEIQNTNVAALDGEKITLTPYQSDGKTKITNDSETSYSGPIVWGCSPENADMNKYFPTSCRTTSTTTNPDED